MCRRWAKERERGYGGERELRGRNPRRENGGRGGCLFVEERMEKLNEDEGGHVRAVRKRERERRPVAV